MSNYSSLINKIVEDTSSLEASLGLLNKTCPSRFFLHSQPTEKVFLFFHGFTAVPYQFEPLGRVLYEAGYNVLIPLQPGHGIAGNWNKDNPPPLPTDIEIYRKFAYHWLEIAESLGEEVIVGGLSSGGVLALMLALENKDKISKTLLYAPYLGGANQAVDFIVKIADIYFDWIQLPDRQHFGYDGFEMPQLRIFLNLADSLLESVKHQVSTPLLLINSASDEAVDETEQKQLFERALKNQPQCWYHKFDESLEIPHTMMTQEEGNHYVDLLIAITQSYIENNITWYELQELRWQMTQGDDLNTAATKLNLSGRVFPSLSVMVPNVHSQIT